MFKIYSFPGITLAISLTESLLLFFTWDLILHSFIDYLSVSEKASKVWIFTILLWWFLVKVSILGMNEWMLSLLLKKLFTFHWSKISAAKQSGSNTYVSLMPRFLRSIKKYRKSVLVLSLNHGGALRDTQQRCSISDG